MRIMPARCALGVRGTLRREMLEEGEHLQAVALAHLLDEGTDGQERAHGQDEVLEEVLAHS